MPTYQHGRGPFTSNLSAYQFEPGRLFLGRSNETPSRIIGIETERHAITIAGAGSGKGAAIIIPNLLRWTGNALVIDPKGEAVEATYAARWNYHGKKVRVLDPFDSANVPEKYKATYNPLADLDPDSLTIKEDIEAISDGIVKRADPKAEHWDDGAQTLISGIIAYVLMTADPGAKNLLQVRKIIRNTEKLASAAVAMEKMPGCAGLCEDAFGLLSSPREREHFISGARKNTKWLDSKAMARCLTFSNFSLDELKTGSTDVFLVLPPNYIANHGRFLRLFVRCAIDAMAKKTASGQLQDKQCLFLLDEFFTLGYIDEIAKAAGLMRGYGLQLWPILQDLGQLTTLYGQDGAATFFGNSDAHIFFGNTDNPTLELISRGCGQIETGDLALPDVTEKDYFRPSGWSQFFGDREAIENEKMDWSVEQENAQRFYQAIMQRSMSDIGKARLPMDRVRDLVAKKQGPVANNMIVFAKGADRLLLRPAPYFLEPEYKRRQQNEAYERHHDNIEKDTIIRMLANRENMRRLCKKHLSAADFETVSGLWRQWDELKKAVSVIGPNTVKEVFPWNVFPQSVEWRVADQPDTELIILPRDVVPRDSKVRLWMLGCPLINIPDKQVLLDLSDEEFTWLEDCIATWWGMWGEGDEWDEAYIQQRSRELPSLSFSITKGRYDRHTLNIGKAGTIRAMTGHAINRIIRRKLAND